MQKIRICIFILFATIVFSTTAQGHDQVGYSFDISFIDELSGNEINTHSLSEIFIVHFWFSNCPPCAEIIEDVKNLYQKYNQFEIDLIGINKDSNYDLFMEYCESNNITWPQVFSKKTQFKEEPWFQKKSPAFYIIENGMIRLVAYSPNEIDKYLPTLIEGSIQ